MLYHIRSDKRFLFLPPRDSTSLHILQIAWLLSLWLPKKGSHIVFTWPFLHYLTLSAAVAAKLLFQFKSDLEFKCVSHLGLHLGHPNFPRQPPSFQIKNILFPKNSFFLWLPEKGSHIVFTWPFVHFLTLPAAVAAKLLFQFKSDLSSNVCPT